MRAHVRTPIRIDDRVVSGLSTPMMNRPFVVFKNLHAGVFNTLLKRTRQEPVTGDLRRSVKPSATHKNPTRQRSYHN